MENFRRKIKRPIQKELLSSHLYTKWVDELEIVVAVNKDLEDDPGPSSYDAQVETRFANKPICNFCVHRYRRCMANELNASSDSDDEDATPKPSSKPTKQKKAAADKQRDDVVMLVFICILY
jgi:hypothetical protein